jgi:hypothetical protein
MLSRRQLLKVTTNLNLLRKIHIYSAALGGFFLILHAAYFITWPLTSAITLGYVSTAFAGVVWITGTAFLERFRESLFFHGTFSLGAIALMIIHAFSAGLNIPIVAAYIMLLLSMALVVFKASKHGGKMLEVSGLVKDSR